MKKSPPSLIFDFSAYAIGLVVGLFLILLAVWADMEASAYDFDRLASAGLNGFQCPLLMTRNETSKISLNVSNRTENQISPSMRVQISTRLVPEESIENMLLSAGEAKTVEWSVGPENIDMGNFIFAKVLLYSAYPLPSREATCGIFVIDWPGTGRIIVPAMVTLSLLGMGWGLQRMSRFRTSNELLKKHMGSIIFLTLMVVAGFIFIFMGSWIPALVALVVAILLIIIVLSINFTDKSR